MNRLISLRAITFAIFFPTLVLAAPCKGPAPASGTPFAGTVRYISDGNRICVGASGSPASWIKVRLADFNPPELREPGGEAAKRTLETIALGKEVQCIAGKRSYDSVVDLTGSFCTKRIDRNWLGKEQKDAEEETDAGADSDAAAAN